MHIRVFEAGSGALVFGDLPERKSSDACWCRFMAGKRGKQGLVTCPSKKLGQIRSQSHWRSVGILELLEAG